MILKTKGYAVGVEEPLVMIATRYTSRLVSDDYCLISDSLYDEDVYTVSQDSSDKQYKGIFNVKSTSHICEGDIICLRKDGYVQTLYRVNSSNNVLFVTGRCNSNCLMCSQPPIDKDDIDFWFHINMKLITLIPKNCPELGISGGEPSLLGDKLFQMISLIKEELPVTEIHMLTNGRMFSYDQFAESLARINSPRIMLGIPLYSDYYQDHDYIVQTKDAYFQTLMGITNLKRYGIRIELRIVLNKLTVGRLDKLARFICANLSNVDKVAFMGMEMVGRANTNNKELWVNPVSYMIQLKNALEILASRKIVAQIYNLPLCFIPQEMWYATVKSISDWKNVLPTECNGCLVMDKCPGFFQSNTKEFNLINPILELNSSDE